MKMCSRCNQRKSLDFFYQDKRTSTGTYSACKECCNVARTTKSGLFSKEKLLMVRWIGIKNRYRLPLYKEVQVLISQKEFFEKFDNSSLDTLFRAWEASGRDTRFIPSIDRIDPNGHYEASNMRWVTRSENSRLARKGKHRRKKVTQMNLDGSFVAVHSSLRNALASMGFVSKNVSNITSALTGRTKTAYGFMWRYTNITETL